MPDSGWLRAEDCDGQWLIRLGGDWRVQHAITLEAQIRAITPPRNAQVLTLDLTAIAPLDTCGALLICRLRERLIASGHQVELRGTSDSHHRLLETVAPQLGAPLPQPAPRDAFLATLERLGRASCETLNITLDFIAFLGRASRVFASGLLQPSQWRVTSLVHHMEQVGLNALPITSLIAFLIGVVVAYQGSVQLARFGAQVFVVDGLALSILRELAILLTAVVVAGRSGSAFTAELGAMVVNEEVDALRTFGLDPMKVLVLPRVWALTLTLPLLAFVADLAGLLGGALVCWFALDIGPALFLERVLTTVDLNDLFVGLSKAPVFAVLIGLIGCHNGLAVSRSAESVGRLTTRSVVQAIFLVIVTDALFSIFFSVVGL